MKILILSVTAGEGHNSTAKALKAELEAGGDAYVAIVVRMPEDVSDKANYRGDVIPEVQLGLIVNATQKKEP